MVTLRFVTQWGKHTNAQRKFPVPRPFLPLSSPSSTERVVGTRLVPKLGNRVRLRLFPYSWVPYLVGGGRQDRSRVRPPCRSMLPTHENRSLCGAYPHNTPTEVRLKAPTRRVAPARGFNVLVGL